MPTYDKNIRYLKEALFAKLNNDPTLETLLGRSGRIFHQSPPQKPVYPCVVYRIIDDRNNPYDETQISRDVTRSNIRITIFSNSSKTEESDNIEARINILLNGQRALDTEKIICYSCLRDNLIEPIKDPNLQVWVTPIRYRTTWATK